MNRRSGMFFTVIILGFLLLVQGALAGTVRFEYDGSGRLVRVEDESTVIEYTYDKMGNKLSETVTALPEVTADATDAATTDTMSTKTLEHSIQGG